MSLKARFSSLLTLALAFLHLRQSLRRRTTARLRSRTIQRNRKDTVIEIGVKETAPGWAKGIAAAV
jgi:hypothetical protein